MKGRTEEPKETIADWLDGLGLERYARVFAETG